MRNRQSSLYGTQSNKVPPAQNGLPAPPPTAPPKRNYMLIGGMLLLAYAFLGEFLLPEPIRFTTIVGERLKNMRNILIEGTADSQALATCKAQRVQLAQQRYMECLGDRTKTGPTCQFIRDDILDFPCQ